jgi:succinoglycan biosynthesis transport protein ExoP
MNAPPSPWEQLAALGALVRRASRRAWVGAIVLALGLAVTAGVVVTTERIYRSETVLLYERGVQSAALNRDPEGPRQVASRLKDMVMSRQRTQKLIEQMKLYPATVDKRGIVEATEEMQKHIVFSSERDGATFRVSYDGQSRQQAKDVLESLVADVIADDTDRHKREVEETRRFLDTERKHADEEVKAKESTLSEFLAKHPQLASETGSTAATGGLLRAADRAGAGTGAEVASLEMQAAQLEQSIAASGPPVKVGGRTIPSGALDPQLLAAQGRAQAELQLAQRDLADKQLHLTNEHPDVRQAIRRLAAAEAAERRATAALTAWRPPAPTPGESAVPADAPADGDGRSAALRRALAAVRQQIAAVRGRSASRAEVPRQLSSVVAIDTEWTRLNREVAEAHERQSQLEGKQFQAQLAATLTADGQGGRIVVADPAFLPMRPIGGKRFKVAMIGGMVSFVLGIAVLGLLALFDDRLYSARDIEGMFDSGIVVVIPKTAPPRLTANVGVKADGPKGDVQSG